MNIEKLYKCQRCSAVYRSFPEHCACELDPWLEHRIEPVYLVSGGEIDCFSNIDAVGWVEGAALFALPLPKGELRKNLSLILIKEKE